MKKLLFLVPILGWVMTYFIWQYSGQFLHISGENLLTGTQFWWVLTDIASPLILVGCTFWYAIEQN